ncbi:MAG TPA: hypothetical protein VGO64_07990 [Candidatus Limnocylindrales bacterium]|nr:hypothetical protein [Candidatus Limnocylindrales bacterium]
MRPPVSRRVAAVEGSLDPLEIVLKVIAENLEHEPSRPLGRRS